MFTKFRLLIVLTLLLPFMLVFTNANAEESETGIDLPTEFESKLEEMFVGGDFNSLTAWDSDTRQTVQFNRTEKDEKGNLMYTSKRHMPKKMRIQKLKDITSFSVVGITVDDPIARGRTLCNIIKIDGQQKVLICKKNEKTDAVVIEEFHGASTKTSRKKYVHKDIEFVSADFVQELEALATYAGNPINEIGFFTAFDNKSKQMRLLVSDNYEVMPLSLLASIIALKDNIISSTIVTYKKNPCCIIVISNGAVVEICRRFC